jgi:hypothetical protein
MRIALLLAACFGSMMLHAQTPNVSVRTIPNYNGWGWSAVVMQNGFITFAAVPAIGGRVMQYDLGTLSSVYTYPAELGKTYTPAPNGQWHNFGGFKTWPAPQSRWPNSWPPPPVLDYGSYAFEIDSLSPPADTSAVTVSSQAEKWIAPRIRFQRRAAVFGGTSRIKMDQTIINDSNAAQSWSVWGVTQAIVNHPGQRDYENFWVYFPINPNSVFGPGGVSPDGQSKAWKGEVAPGVYGVQFSPDGRKIYGDPHKGWIAYVNQSDTVVFAKTFDIVHGAQYPDGGSRVAVYVSGSVAPIYLEVEIKSPTVQLAANGGTYSFTENWWAARASGPILDVDSVGAVTGRLSYNAASRSLSALYGVFYKGTARVAFLDAGGQLLAEGQPHAVSPLSVFRLEDTVAIPGGAARAEVRIYDEPGGFRGILDTADVYRLISAVGTHSPAVPPGYSLAPGYPNPFNGGTVLTVSCTGPAQGVLRICDMLGREVALLKSGTFEAGEHRYTWNPGKIASGLYLASLEIGGTRQVQRLVYVR